MKRILIALLALFCFMLGSLSAQTVKELEAQKKKTLEQLSLTNKLLNETSKSRQGTVQQITLLNNSIKQSTKMLSILNDEIADLTNHLDTIRTERTYLEERLATAKENYSKLLAQNHIHKKHFSPILFILSAENLSQAYRRFRYLSEISSSYKKVALEIEELTTMLGEKEQTYLVNLTQKEQVVGEKERETNQLNQKKIAQDKVLSGLKKKEKDLQKQQKRQQEQADKLNRVIQQKVAEEIKKEQERARKEAEAKAKAEGKTPDEKTPEKTTEQVYAMSKEEQLVAGNFEKNRGKLPMPVEKGFVSSHFGIQPHPVLPRVTTNNKGIYIQTPAGADARAIFEGTVVQCFTVAGSNATVLVKHGNYFTLYSNLTQLYVKVGDKVATKQKLGKIFVDTEDSNKTELYLMIYKDTAIQNPEHWIAL